MSNSLFRPAWLLTLLTALCTVTVTAAESASSIRQLTDLSRLAETPADIPPYEILMIADTIARFDGIFDMPKWTPPGSREPATHPVAVFTIITFQTHARPGKYGDDYKNGAVNTFMVDMDKVPFCQYSNALRDIAALRPGEIVRLCWMHIYVDQNGSRYPERPVTLLQPARVPEGAQLPPPYTPPPAGLQARPL